MSKQNKNRNQQGQQNQQQNQADDAGRQREGKKRRNPLPGHTDEKYRTEFQN